jgi:hypothetical protein
MRRTAAISSAIECSIAAAKDAGVLVDVAGISPGEREQSQVRKPFQQRAGEARAFANRHDDLVGQEARHELVLRLERVAEQVDGRAAVEPLPVRKGKDLALVVVEDGDALHAGKFTLLWCRRHE